MLTFLFIVLLLAVLVVFWLFYFEEKVRSFGSIVRQRGAGEVTRVGLEEYEKTRLLIKNLELDGPMLDSATELLEIQFEGLRKNLSRYTSVEYTSDQIRRIRDRN